LGRISKIQAWFKNQSLFTLPAKAKCSSLTAVSPRVSPLPEWLAGSVSALRPAPDRELPIATLRSCHL